MNDLFLCSYVQELHSRAQGELSIREALKELEIWGSKAAFAFSSFEDSQHHSVQIIRGWSDIIQEVCTSLCESEGTDSEWVLLQ